MEQNSDFEAAKKRAAERMLELSKKTGGEQYKMPPVPPFVKLNRNGENTNNQKGRTAFAPKKQQSNGMPEALSEIPVLNRLKNDPDAALIAGILLILFGDSNDKILSAALLYILL